MVQDSKKLAGQCYHPGMKSSQDETSQGLSVTHEQIVDYYADGTVDRLIEKK